MLNQTTTFTYDVKGNVASVKDALGKTTTMTYTLLGQIATVTDPLGRTVTYAYTGPDLISMTDALGRTVQFGRDALGRVTSTTDPLGRVSTVQYDLLDRVVSTTDPAGKVTAMQRDGEGLLLQLTDPTNKVFKWAYDWAGRVTTQTDPLNQVETYAYNLNGNPSTITDRKNQVTTYSYDALDRQISATDPVATQTYSYDTLDRLTGITEGSKTLAYSYNTLDQLTSETTPQGAVLYAYDVLGKRTSMTIGSAVTGYTYDAGNRITAMTRGTQTVGFGYDAADRTTSVTLPNGTVMGYGYDNGNQLTGINYVKGATNLGNLTYTYDTAGQRTGMGGSFARTLLPTAVPNASYDANNRQTAWGTKALTYDINGNLTGDGTYTYLWNARDQLTQVKQGATTVSNYSYDAVGRRTAKTLGAATTSYLYDGVNAVKETTGSSTADLLSLGVDQVFSRSETGGTQSLLTDGLGSTLALGDGAGTLGTTYTYGAYGQTQSAGAASTNSTQYTGREQDAAGLYYYRARYYSTDLSRFISQDPIGLGGGLNWYGYANGNPVVFRDPYGLSGIGVYSSGNVSVGVGIAGAGANGSAGTGLFSGDGYHTPSAGAYVTGGAAANAGPAVAATTPNPNILPIIVGGGGSVGLGVFITNADTVEQLGGSASNINVSVGPFSGSLATAVDPVSGNVTWQASFGIQAGVGLDTLVSADNISTDTGARTGLGNTPLYGGNSPSAYNPLYGPPGRVYNHRHRNGPCN